MLSSRKDLTKLRKAYSAALKLQTKKILVCAGTGCVAGGSIDIYNELLRLIEI